MATYTYTCSECGKALQVSAESKPQADGIAWMNGYDLYLRPNARGYYTCKCDKCNNNHRTFSF